MHQHSVIAKWSIIVIFGLIFIYVTIHVSIKIYASIFYHSWNDQFIFYTRDHVCVHHGLCIHMHYRNSCEFITSRHSLWLWRLRKSANQWLFVAKKKQGLELGGLYFRRVPFILFYGACSQNERKLGCVELKKLLGDSCQWKEIWRKQVVLLQLLRIDYGVLESDHGIDNKESHSLIC
jgi:hypothetical protein